MWLSIIVIIYAAVFLFAQKIEINRLRQDCAEAYQIIGAMADESYPFVHPDVQRALDNMSAATNGRPRPHEDLLPWPRGEA